MGYYDSIAEGYGELHREEQLKKLAIIKDIISVKKEDRMLDVGCGTGISSDFACFVVGIDPSINLLEKGKGKMRILGAAEMLPFKDNSFDYVISVTAIHNFEDVKKSIAEMKRVGTGNFIFSLLKKSPKLPSIKKLVVGDFKIRKEVEEDKDVILFCSKT